MKLTVTAVLCTSLLLVDINFSLATKTEKGWLQKILKKPTKTKSTNTKSKESVLTKGKQPTQHNQGNYPQQPAGGYPQYPGQPGGYPYPGGHPQYPGYPAGGYPAQDHMFGGYGNSPGSYINHNPNNQILSPHYGGSFGFGGYRDGRGSPFSHLIKAMGHAPSSESKGFGRSAVMAATRGAVAKMALGYGLGRFPRPHFHFHSPQEEYFFNYYMYKKYGIKSNDKNDYSRDYQYSQPPEAFDRYMESCLKRTDLLQGENQTLKAPKITIASVNTTTTSISANTSSGANAGGSSTASPSTPQPLNISKVGATTPLAPQVFRADDDDDTVSIVEIGYPALIKQMKVKRCTELFIVYADRHLKKKTPPTVPFDKPLNKNVNTTSNNGVQGLKMGFQGLLSVLTITTLMLMNNNMLMLLN